MRRERDPASARRAQEACPGVAELPLRDDEDGGALELAREVEVDVARDAVDRAALRPDERERPREEDRVGERDRRRPFVGDPLGRERVERSLGPGGARREERDRRPHDGRAKVEEPLVSVGEDAAVNAHRLDGEGGLDSDCVDRFLPGGAVARVLEDVTVARAEQDALARLRDDLARGEELPLTDATDHDG